MAPQINFLLAGDNLYGRRSIPEMRDKVGARRVRRAVTYDNRFIHRDKNGINDPLTFYHILDLVMQMTPGTEFRTGDLLVQLRAFKDQLVWDATTVGRVLTDIAENLYEAHGFKAIDFTKRWNGMFYVTSTEPRAQVVLFNLLEDLVLLCEEEVRAELAGRRPKRLRSPMESCPSLAV